MYVSRLQRSISRWVVTWAYGPGWYIVALSALRSVATWRAASPLRLMRVGRGAVAAGTTAREATARTTTTARKQVPFGDDNKKGKSKSGWPVLSGFIRKGGVSFVVANDRSPQRAIVAIRSERRSLRDTPPFVKKRQRMGHPRSATASANAAISPLRAARFGRDDRVAVSYFALLTSMELSSRLRSMSLL